MRERLADKGLCIFFVAALAICFVISIIKPDTGFSEFENRYMSRKPELSMDGIFDGSYMEDYESYITDQFPFRNQWITLKTLTERVMLKSEINGVYFAEDDYYIEKHQKSELFSDMAIKNGQVLINFAGKYAEMLGADHVFVMLVPTASAVLQDKLPFLAPDDGQEERLEAVRKDMPEGVWVDVYDMLSAHSAEEIYYKTDHHWTTLGAFYGYCAWKEKQGDMLPDRAEYEEICLTDDFQGTLYAKVNVEMQPDSIYAFVRPEETVRMRLDMAGEWWDTLYAEDKLATRDKYAVFCDGNHGLTEVETELSNGKHLLLVKDSYAHCLLPFLTADFERITMIDLRYYNGSIESYIREQNVTDVLTVYNLAGFSSDRYVNKLTN